MGKVYFASACKPRRQRVFVAKDSTELDDLAHKINVCLTKADDYLVTTACHLAEAKAICKKRGITFKASVEANIKLSYRRAKELARAGES
jgi:hypothetical protein